MSDHRVPNRRTTVQLFDEAILRVAASSYAEIEGERLLRELEECRSLPQYQLTPREEKKLNRVINRCRIRRTMRGMGKSGLRVVRGLSMVFLAASIAVGSSMVASASFRDVIYRLIFRNDPQYTLVRISTEMEDTPVDEIYNWEGAYAPYRLPKGYHYVETIDLNMHKKVAYQNELGNKISFLQSLVQENATYQVDTENAEIIQQIVIQGEDALLSVKSGRVSISWKIDDTILCIVTEEPIETAIAVAQNVRLVQH